jgi:ribosomal protein S14
LAELKRGDARGEAAENFDRKDFTLSEAVAIKREIEPEIKAEAKERQRDAGQNYGRGKIAGAKLAPAIGKARDKVAAFTGVKRSTLEKAEAIVKAAEAEPKKFGKLLDDMNRTGRADGVFKRLKVARQAEEIKAEPPPFARPRAVPRYRRRPAIAGLASTG